jgi:hypothetical protein
MREATTRDIADLRESTSRDLSEAVVRLERAIWSGEPSASKAANRMV